MSKSPPTDCFLNELAYIFPNQKDPPDDHELFDSNKYTIPSKYTCDAVNKGVLKAIYLADAKERENSHLNEVVIEIKTAALLAALWISYGHPAHNKRAGYSFEFPLAITLAVI